MWLDPRYSKSKINAPRGGAHHDRHRSGGDPPEDFLGLDASSPMRSATSATPSARSSRPRLPYIGDWFEAGRSRATRPRAGQLDVLGMHLRATGARVRARPRTVWRAWSSRPATAACAASSRSRAPSRCMRSTLRLAGAEAAMAAAMAAGDAIGCFGLTEPDAGSDPARCARGRAATAATGSCTGRRCGSPTARSPTSPWCGRAPTRGCAASSCPRAPGLHHAGHPPQAVAARVGHLRAAARRRPPAGRGAPARGDHRCPGRSAA